MDLRTAFLADDLVQFIDDVEDFLGNWHAKRRLGEVGVAGQTVGRRRRRVEGRMPGWARVKTDGMDQLREGGPLLQDRVLAASQSEPILVHAGLLLL
jgi:hypothetical protein